MLTYQEKNIPKRKDLPWLLFVLVLIWVSGTAFFHSPWEPYEPFVLAVVIGILHNNSCNVIQIKRLNKHFCFQFIYLFNKNADKNADLDVFLL